MDTAILRVFGHVDPVRLGMAPKLDDANSGNAKGDADCRCRPDASGYQIGGRDKLQG